MTERPDVHRDLVKNASQGDGRAMADLLARHLPGLLVYVRLHAGAEVREHESCSDLAQSVCREALAGMADFEYQGEGPFRKWLYTLAMSKIRDRWRYWQAERRAPAREVGSTDGGTPFGPGALLPSFTTPSQVAIRGEDLARLEQAFAVLPEDYRQVITLARIMGLSHREIAAEMGRQEGAVRVLLHRALVRLGYLMSREQ